MKSPQRSRLALLVIPLTGVLGAAVAVNAGAFSTSRPLSRAAAPPTAPPTKNVVMGGSKYTGVPKGSPVNMVFVGDLAGKIGSFGPFVLHGAQLMVDIANKNGGIMGHPVKLFTGEDQADPAKTATITKQLIATKRPKMIFGGILSSSLLAQAPLARQNKIPTFPTSASVTDWIQKNSSLYNGMTLNTSRQDSCGFAKFVATKHPDWKRFAVLRVTFAYGADFFKGFQECLRRFNPSAQIVSVKDYDFGTTNFLPLVNAVLADKPDFIIGIIFGTDFVRFYQQYRGTGSKVPIAGVLTDLEAARAFAKQGTVPDNFVYDAGPRARYTELGSSAKPWIDAFKKKYGDVPSADGLQGMSAFLVYKAAVEKAGTFDPTRVMRVYRCMTYYEPRGWVKIRTLNGQADVPETFGAFQQVAGAEDMRMNPKDSLKVTGHEVWLSDTAAKVGMPRDAIMSPSQCKVKK
jgi:branched-chain amino acid transport system substrate-binding protein